MKVSHACPNSTAVSSPAGDSATLHPPLGRKRVSPRLDYKCLQQLTRPPRNHVSPRLDRSDQKLPENHSSEPAHTNT